MPNCAGRVDGAGLLAHHPPRRQRGRGVAMRGMRQWRQAVVWGCVAWFSNCPWNDVRTNAIPLEFGMTPDVVATALGVPIVHVSGGAGNEVYYAERSTLVPSLFTYDRRLWLQFRNGRLTGWKNDYQRGGPW
jgi:hypothetical protein